MMRGQAQRGKNDTGKELRKSGFWDFLESLGTKIWEVMASRWVS